MNDAKLNDISVQQLYEYPESCVMEKNLYFLVCSKEKKGNNLQSVDLADLKHKIKNVILVGSKEIKTGDYIIAKKFSYKYGKTVEIIINDFEKIEGISLGFYEGLKEYKKDGILDCYFLYKKKNK